MTVSVDWVSKIINVEKTDTDLVQLTPTEIRSLDFEAFHLSLRTLEASPEGMPFDKTHIWITGSILNAFQIPPVMELINNYTIEFENGFYSVNIIGVNNNFDDKNQVNDVNLRYSAEQVTIQDEINSQSYMNARIYIDNATGVIGNSFPVGTPKTPAKDWTSAIAVQVTEKLTSFQIIGPYTFAPSDDLSEKSFFTDNLINNRITLSGGNTDFTHFHDSSITGTMNGRSNFTSCALTNIVDFAGGGFNLAMRGTISVDPTFNGQISVFQSGSGENGLDRPIIDFTTSTTDAIFVDWSGGLFIKNFSQGANFNITLNSGAVYIDSTSISGNLLVNGIGQVYNFDTGEPIGTGTYNGSLTLVNDTIVSKDVRDARKFMSNKVRITNNKTKVTVFDDDGVNILQEFDVTNNQLNRDPI